MARLDWKLSDHFYGTNIPFTIGNYRLILSLSVDGGTFGFGIKYEVRSKVFSIHLGVFEIDLLF